MSSGNVVRMLTVLAWGAGFVSGQGVSLNQRWPDAWQLLILPALATASVAFLVRTRPLEQTRLAARDEA